MARFRFPCQFRFQFLLWFRFRFRSRSWHQFLLRFRFRFDSLWFFSARFGSAWCGFAFDFGFAFSFGFGFGFGFDVGPGLSFGLGSARFRFCSIRFDSAQLGWVRFGLVFGCQPLVFGVCCRPLTLCFEATCNMEWPITSIMI